MLFFQQKPANIKKRGIKKAEIGEGFNNNDALPAISKLEFSRLAEADLEDTAQNENCCCL